MQKILLRLSQMKKKYIGEHDETDVAIYTNKRIIVPNPLRKYFFLKQVKPDRRKKRFGRVKGHLFNYISTPMVIVTLALILGVIKSWSMIFVFLSVSAYLNGTIVSFMIFGIMRVYYNNFLLFRAASFMRHLERVSEQERITRDDVGELRRELEKKAELLNTKYMFEVLDSLEELGYLKISDNQARFIKAKLGFRVNHNRKGVNFIAGILVMFGLLGTFLGLLKTIDAVGGALGNMANLGAGGGDLGMEEMSSFIGSLAAPLQGMGLAFSSSLFGLSGSLIIGFFLHLAGTPQNYFIENAARWIDDRIFKFNPKKLAENAQKEKTIEGVQQAKKQAQPKANDNDLKDWLTGYVYLSTQTNKKLDSLTEAIGRAGHGVSEASQNLKIITGQQDSLIDIVRKLGGGLRAIIDHADKIDVRVSDIQDLSHVMNTAMTSIDVSNRKIAKVLPSISETIQGSGVYVVQAVQEVNSSVAKIVQEANFSVVQAVNSMSVSMAEIGRTNAIVGQSIPDVATSLGLIREDSRKYASAFYSQLKLLNQGQSEIIQTGAVVVPSIGVVGEYLQKIKEQQNNAAAINNEKGNDIRQVLEKIESSLVAIEHSNRDLIKVLSSGERASVRSKAGIFRFLQSKKVQDNSDC